MNKIVFLLFSVVCLCCGHASAQTAAAGNEPKPFVGKWGFWQDNCSYELTLDLYGEPVDGCYGLYSDFCEDGGMEYRIVRVRSIKGYLAEVTVDGGQGEKQALLNYSPGTGKMMFVVTGQPVVFNAKDKYAFVTVHFGDSVDVRTAPVSGTTMFKARRGQSFPFLGMRQGWFEVRLSASDKRVGYISPEYAQYLKEATVPDEVFTRSYSRDLCSFELTKSGNDKVVMMMTTMRPPVGDRIIPALVETYAGVIKDNAVVLTHWENGYTENPDISKMTRLEQPLVAYYMKDSGMFVIDGENYWAE